MDSNMLSHFPSDDYTATANRAVATYSAGDTGADNTGRYQGSEQERIDREEFRHYAEKGMQVAKEKQEVERKKREQERKKRDEEANKDRKTLSTLSPPQVSFPLRRYKSLDGGKKTRRWKKRKKKENQKTQKN